MCWRPRQSVAKVFFRARSVAYLVRSFRTYARIRSLTTGTFNQVVKDRIAFRLSGANSVQANTHECVSDCPRNPTNIRLCAKPCQRKRPTEFPPDFHKGTFGAADRRAEPQGLKPVLGGFSGATGSRTLRGSGSFGARNGIAFRSRKRLITQAF